ncbi:MULTISPECIES: hypothetical protein [Anaerofustis]|uniref:hypothetical protein n=1 Tax=Anaerofustis TaxID=264995 RepID=UPI001105FF04|nr:MULTISPECIES: hypothetical protein [Anaerofustis]MCO8194422.1 hypothetical protein [Anaerofustis sp. NSJ-163]
MKKDVYDEYLVLVNGLYKGQVSYIFEEMINALKNNNKVMLFTLDMERLMDHVLELNNNIQALELEKKQFIYNLKKKYPYINL